MSHASTAINWPQIMRAGIGRLGLAPDVFWALTPAELMVMLGQGAGAPAGGPMGRARLADLLRAFPDERAEKGKDDE